jgi:hypothetical protein
MADAADSADAAETVEAAENGLEVTLASNLEARCFPFTFPEC